MCLHSRSVRTLVCVGVAGIGASVARAGDVACPLFPVAQFSVGEYPMSVAAGDLDGDGDQDLVAANDLSEDVSVLLNTGDGTFAADVRYPVGGYAVGVAVGDLNGDGSADLAVANLGNNSVSVFLNNGDIF